MAEQFADQQFVEYVIKSIVDHPDAVKAERTIDEMGVLITLSVSPEDMGQVIGRQGQTAKSVRTLLRVIGAKNDARVNLKILEPEGGKRFKEFQEQDQRMSDQSHDLGQPSQTSAAAAGESGLEPPKPEASPMDNLSI
ncbi:MAG: KH domain-containing protein [Candidatus Andersenbacteria bacterium]